MKKNNKTTTQISINNEGWYGWQTVPAVSTDKYPSIKPPNAVDEAWDEGGNFDRITELSKKAPSGPEILSAGLDIIELLLEKNVAYGNSAVEPLRLFSSGSPEEQILVRVDDKLSRLKNNQSYPGDNDIDDLIGYLLLLKVVRRKSND